MHFPGTGYINKLHCPKRIAFIAFLLGNLLLCFPLSAQDTAKQTLQQIWPEVDVFYKLNERFRLSAFVSATRLNKSSFADGAFSMQLDYFGFPVLRKIKTDFDSARGHYLWLRVGYYYSNTTPSAKKQVTVNAIQTTVNNRFYPGWKSMLTLRNRIDWRIVNGDLDPRYRPRITWEKNFSTGYVHFNAYTYGEYFLNFGESVQNQFRLCLGVDLKISKQITYETYYLRQFGNGTEVLPLNAYGFVLKFYLTAKRKH